MLKKYPKGMPSLGDMLRNLGEPSTRELAKALGVSERTAREWKRKNTAPRTAMLALFWVTSWGQQWAEADAHNEAQAQRQLAEAFRRRNAELENVIAQLMKIGRFDSANDPNVNAGVSLRDRALLLRNQTPTGFWPIRVTIPNAPHATTAHLTRPNAQATPEPASGTCHVLR